MKNFFKIGEISKLYNIGCDSLRYYEKLGILNPTRDTNNYRLYSIDDIFKLNIISELRRLNFSVSTIGEYLQTRTVDSTKKLLTEEIEIVNEHIDYYQKLKKNLNIKLNCIEKSQNENNNQSITKKYIKKRKILYIQENLKSDSEVDFMLKKLQQTHKYTLSLFGNKKIGAGFCLDSLNKHIYDTFNYVFFLLDDADKDYDKILPEGEYVCITYKGDYSQSKIYLKQAFEYIKKYNLKILQEPIEIYKIDIHETSNKNEYVTEIQLLIE